MNKSKISAVMLSASLALLATVPATALTAKTFKYSTPKTGYLSISVTDMFPDNSSAGTNYVNSWGGGTLIGDGCYNTGIHLPQGAKITELAYAHVGIIYVGLFEKEFFSNTGATYFVDDDSPAAAARTVETVNFPAAFSVNNATKNYGLGICLNPGEAFYGARVKYTYNRAGD